uniref:Centromere protein U n=1 Tax=Molossus molossus TaxID=27622 RepID=A0A7J8GKN6_MOLMO|nr:centromere protein U [Molossus molossus]
MASPWWVRPLRGASARYSKNTVGRTYSMEDKASQLHKPIHVYDFSDNSDISSVGRMNENEKDEDSYESFEPPLHSTAIYTDEVELSRHCGSFLPSTPPGKDAKRRMFCGKRKKSRNEARDTDISDCEHIWCLKGKKSSDIMDLDVVLSAFEKAFPEYKQNVESKICKEAINKFHSSMKEELIKMLAEVQMLTALRRKNAKMISDIEKKRQRLIEVQDELLWSEPQLKQLQIKYDELKEKKSSLRNAAYFLSNLKQLHQDYSDIQEREPNVKETYDSSSLPALLFKARTLLGAESHLQNINHQLEKLLDQK